MGTSESEINQEFAKNSTTSLRWLCDDKIQIIWDNGESDLIFLTPQLSLIGATNDSCTFIGKLEKDSMAEATVVGCRSSDETIVTIGAYYQVKIFIMSNGTTLEVNQNSMNHHRSSRLGGDALDLFGRTDDEFDLYGSDGDYNYDGAGETNEFDSRESGKDPPNLSASFDGPLPREITIRVGFGYDHSLLRRLGMSSLHIYLRYYIFYIPTSFEN